MQGGIEKHCQELFPRLVARGLQVTLLARKGYVPDRPFVYRGVSVVPLIAPHRKNFETFVHTLVGFLWLVRHGSRFDIVHVHGIGPAFFAPFFRLLGLKVVITSHGPDYLRRKWSLLARLGLVLGERLGTRYSHAVIAVSSPIRNQVKSQYGLEPFLIPNGATLPMPGDHFNLLAGLGLQSGRYILAVGRFVPEKGFHDLLNAFVKLDTDLQLVIAGSSLYEDGYASYLKKRAANMERVVLPGFLTSDKLDVLYAHAALFVLTSYHEGMSLALLEALAHSLPVLVSDIPANRDVEIPEERYFRSGDQADLLCKLEKLLKKRISERECEANRKMMAQKYNWDRIAEQTMEVYGKVLRDED